MDKNERDIKEESVSGKRKKQQQQQQPSVDREHKWKLSTLVENTDRQTAFIAKSPVGN